MKVKIKGEEYEFSFSSVWGVLYDFETLTSGKVAYNSKLMLHNHICIYGILIRCNSSFNMGFEEFVEALNDTKLAEDLISFYIKRMNTLTMMGNEREESKKKRKG